LLHATSAVRDLTPFKGEAPSAWSQPRWLTKRASAIAGKEWFNPWPILL